MLKKNDSSVLEQINKSSIFQADEQKSELQNKKLDENIVIKIGANHKKILTDYFKNSKGVGISTGIRQLVFDFMKKENLL